MRTKLSILIIVLLALTLACNLPNNGNITEADLTQMALDVQATVNARIQQTQTAAAQAQQLTQTAQDAQATNMAEQLAVAAQETAQAQQLTEIALTNQASLPATTGDPPTATPTPTPVQEPAPSAGDLDEMMRNANILLFEDMSGDFSTTRFVKQALDNLGYPYVDVKDAAGNYKTQLLSGGPGGEGWDLIISATELRSVIQGEFYTYLNDNLNQGSAVIIELWNMNDIANGKISSILGRCGVEFQADWDDEPLSLQLLYAVNGQDSIHHTPNEGISLTNPTGFWTGDLGDLMRLAPGSNAVALWSARTNQKSSHLTAVECEDGRLIIQTHSTHNYGKTRSVQMWENYIYNALEAKLTGQ